MTKEPILYCKCKLCGCTYFDRYPSNRDRQDGKYIANYTSVISTTHDCSTGGKLMPDAFGV